MVCIICAVCGGTLVDMKSIVKDLENRLSGKSVSDDFKNAIDSAKDICGK